jgi:hypothetical protein
VPDAALDAALVAALIGPLEGSDDEGSGADVDGEQG